MSNFFNFNGNFFVANSPMIGIDNRGFKYGDGLFETMKIVDGKIVYSDFHFERLWKGLKTLYFEIPSHFSPTKFANEILNLAEKNNHQNLARVRLNLFRSDGVLNDIDNNNQPSYTIQTWALPQISGKWNIEGLSLGVYLDVKKTCDILSNLKTNNYLPNVLSTIFSKKNGWDDVVLLNSHNRICETSIANIFMIKNKIIYTPSLQEGCVAGVFRQVLINYLLSLNYLVVETSIATEELLNADEVFITNSIKGINWVKQIRDKKFTNLITKNIYTEMLNR